MEAKITTESTVKAAREQVSAGLGDEAVILGLNQGEYYGLNEVGARIWQLIQEPRRVGDVRDALLEEFDVEFDRCEQDVLRLLGQLASEGLIEVEE